ncbi:MAG: hypothetical protein UD936_00990 [Acutalibacteraceae bacterium]|nr:hypothetical protein [Acutalibacteraceae bacterium]
MDFKKKLKIRLFLAIGYIILGLAMIVIFNIIKTENTFLSSFGLALTVVGIAKTRNYFLITKNEETLKKQQIAENDERNIAIANKAKSVSFVIYIIIVCSSVTVLYLLNHTALANILSASVCVLVMIYWISYWIINKKS